MPDPSPPTLIRGGTVLTAAGPLQEGASVLFQDGTIVAVGAGVTAPPGARVVDP